MWVVVKVKGQNRVIAAELQGEPTTEEMCDFFRDHYYPGAYFKTVVRSERNGTIILDVSVSEDHVISSSSGARMAYSSGHGLITTKKNKSTRINKISPEKREEGPALDVLPKCPPPKSAHIDLTNVQASLTPQEINEVGTLAGDSFTFEEALEVYHLLDHNYEAAQRALLCE